MFDIAGGIVLAVLILIAALGFLWFVVVAHHFDTLEKRAREIDKNRTAEEKEQLEKESGTPRYNWHK